VTDAISSIDYWQQRGYQIDPLHLVTQRGQPYGSTRRCCEECGRMCWIGMAGSAKRWTDDPQTWAEDRLNCRSVSQDE
jgi:hypothetical protein